MIEWIVLGLTTMASLAALGVTVAVERATRRIARDTDRRIEAWEKQANAKLDMHLKERERRER